MLRIDLVHGARVEPGSDVRRTVTDVDPAERGAVPIPTTRPAVSTAGDHQGDLFAPRSAPAPVTGRTAPARASDPQTSHQAAKAPFQRDSQRHLLLREYAKAERERRVGIDTTVTRTTNEATAYGGVNGPSTTERRTTTPSYRSATVGGMTDEEAATAAGITRGCPWKRCSELRESLMIAIVPGETRTSTGGAAQQVCKITGKGQLVLREIEEGVGGA